MPEESTLVLIPAYNPGPALGKLIDDIRNRRPRLPLLVVDDGSHQAVDFAALGVNGFRFPENRGKGAALAAGLSWARRQGFRYAVTMDCDGQHLPEDLDGFLEGGPFPKSLVLGVRKKRHSAMPLHRRFSNAATSRILSRLAGQHIPDSQSGYRMYALEHLEEGLLPSEGRFDWESRVLVILSRKGYTIRPVPVQTVYSGNGSHVKPVRDTLRFLRMVWNLYPERD